MGLVLKGDVQAILPLVGHLAASGHIFGSLLMEKGLLLTARRVEARGPD